MTEHDKSEHDKPKPDGSTDQPNTSGSAAGNVEADTASGGSPD